MTHFLNIVELTKSCHNIAANWAGLRLGIQSYSHQPRRPHETESTWEKSFPVLGEIMTAVCTVGLSIQVRFICSSGIPKRKYACFCYIPRSHWWSSTCERLASRKRQQYHSQLEPTTSSKPTCSRKSKTLLVYLERNSEYIWELWRVGFFKSHCLTMAPRT